MVHGVTFVQVHAYMRHEALKAFPCKPDLERISKPDRAVVTTAWNWPVLAGSTLYVKP